MVEPLHTDDEKVADIREMLPATGAGIYLDTATAGPFPAETARALAEADEWELKVGRGGPDRDADVAQRDAEARAVVAALLGADADDIVLMFGADDAVRWLPDGAAVADLRYVAGVEAIDVTALSVDAAVLDGHRWLLGPEGSGALWLRPGARGRHAKRPNSPTLPRRSLLGLARSLGWLEMFVGLPWAYERTARLSALLSEELAVLHGVDLLPSPGPAVVTFTIGGWTAEQTGEELSRRVFAILGSAGERDAVRASVGFWNTEAELTRFAEVVAVLAGHTPDSLPRRPGLAILTPSDDRA